ncbi:MAG: hypothetical protein NZ699_18020 [Roseiflexus sp.]|nr:hypothetical protein [Roseiflexus sp.]
MVPVRSPAGSGTTPLDTAGASLRRCIWTMSCFGYKMLQYARLPCAEAL